MCEEAGVEYTEFQVAVDALTVVVNTRERLGHLPDGRPAQEDLGARRRGQGHELEPGRPELPGPGAGARGPRHRLGHLRLLHRRDQRRGGREPRRLHRQRGRQRHRPGGRRRAGRPRLLRLHVLRGEPGHAQGRRDRRRRRLRRSERRTRPATAPTRRSPGRSSSTSRTSRSRKPEVYGFVEYFLTNSIQLAEDALFIPVPDEQVRRRTSRRSRRPEGLDRVATHDTDRRRAAGPRSGCAPSAGAGARTSSSRPRPLRARLGRDDGRASSSRSRPLDRVLPRGLDRRLLLRRALGAALRAGVVRRAARCSSARSSVTFWACVVALRSGSARPST